MLKLVATTLTLALCAATAASQTLKSHPTTEAEFVGPWHALDVAVSFQPPKFRSAPLFSGRCQFFLHHESKRWDRVNIENLGGADSTASECSTKRGEQLFKDQQVFAPKLEYTWAAIPNRPGFSPRAASLPTAVLFGRWRQSRKISMPALLSACC